MFFFLGYTLLIWSSKGPLKLEKIKPGNNMINFLPHSLPSDNAKSMEVSLVNGVLFCPFSPLTLNSDQLPSIFLFFCKFSVQDIYRSIDRLIDRSIYIYLSSPQGYDLIWQICLERERSRHWDWSPWVKWMLYSEMSQLVPRKCNF